MLYVVCWLPLENGVWDARIHEPLRLVGMGFLTYHTSIAGQGECRFMNICSFFQQAMWHASVTASFNIMQAWSCHGHRLYPCLYELVWYIVLSWSNGECIVRVESGSLIPSQDFPQTFHISQIVLMAAWNHTSTDIIDNYYWVGHYELNILSYRYIFWWCSCPDAMHNPPSLIANNGRIQSINTNFVGVVQVLLGLQMTSLDELLNPKKEGDPKEARHRTT